MRESFGRLVEMVRLRWFAVAILFGLVSPALTIAGNLYTQNQFVKAQVDDQGKVVWYVISPSSYPISYSPSQSMSFLTVQLGPKYYTNSTQDPQLPAALLPNLLSLGNSTNTLLKSATNDGCDTVRSVWKIGPVSIVQDVYPFAYVKSGQIVLKVRVLNYGTQQVTAQAQYLLDIDVDNDAAKVLTRWGYSPNWNQYVKGGAPPLNDIPWFYMGFKTPLPAGAAGESSTGYLTKSEEGLMTPNRVTIGDWGTLVNWIWGPPPLPNAGYGDDAILMEWGPQLLPPVRSDGTPNEAELLRTSYGTGEFEICSGILTALTFYPHRLSCTGDQYSPTDFTLESLVFNTDESRTASAVNISLHTTAPISISGPPQVDPGGHSSTQSPPSGALQPLQVTDLIWNLHADQLASCNGDSTTYVQITASAQGIGMPVIGDCYLPIILECCDKDTVAPKYDSFSGSVFDTSFHVHDSGPQDKGMKSVTWSVASTNPAAFKVTTTPGMPLSGCPKTDVVVQVQQLDSTVAGCVSFTFMDCASNTSYRTICFASHIIPSHPDLAAPIITKLGTRHWPTIMGKLDSGRVCTAQIDTFFVEDTGLYAQGLQQIRVGGSVQNMRLVALPIAPGVMKAGFATEVVDSLNDGFITVVAEDVAGNLDSVLITYCTVPDTVPPRVTIQPISNLNWTVIVTDSMAWDRGLKDVQISSLDNVTLNPVPTPALVHGLHVFTFDATGIDKFEHAGFCVKALDSAGNASTALGTCASVFPPTDIWVPHIVITPGLSTNPTSVTVKVDDIHVVNGDTTEFDTGIDSVWFTGVHNMTLVANGNTYVNLPSGPSVPFPALKNPYLGGHHPFADTLAPFTLTVSDLTATDALACVTIHVMDGRMVRDSNGVNQRDTTWCYPIIFDSLAPVITGTSPDRSHIVLHITDERIQDQGLGQVELMNTLNFEPLQLPSTNLLVYNRDSATSVTLTVAQPGQSSLARVQATDDFGTRLTDSLLKSRHITTSDLWIYAQNLQMNAAHVVMQSGDFDVPVFLDSTDAVPLLQKQISQYAFGFHLTGSPNIQFVAPVSTGTMSDGWAVSATPLGARAYSLSGVAVPAGSVLNAPGGATYEGSTDAKPLVILRFHGDSSEYSGLTTVAIDGEPGAEIVYNGGGMQTLTGPNSSVDIPKPYGTMRGGNIILKGFCSPAVTVGTMPTVVSLELPYPTPAVRGRNATISAEYDLPERGADVSKHVTIELWSLTGEKITTLVDVDHPAGRYLLTIPTAQLTHGTYILRMVSRGVVVSRRAVVQ